MIKPAYISFLKKIIFATCLALLFIPMWQQYKRYAQVEPLNGSYTQAADPTLQLNSWLTGNYQCEKQEYLNEQFGYRADFVRLHNETYYRLFNQARANNVLIGKEDYLFGRNYVSAYTGTDFLGAKEIKSTIDMLGDVRDSLAEKGTQLIVILAPGKASFYPEYLPTNYQALKKDSNNHDYFLQHLLKANIHTLDFLTWFAQMKDTSTYPLFPKTGIHWSKYGEVLAADSLLRYTAKVLGTPMPSLDIIKLETCDTVRDTDDDIEKGMNIISPIPDLKMGYFTTQVRKDSAQRYPRLSAIGDSYYWGLGALGLTDQAFAKGDFWYYFAERHHTDGQEMKRIETMSTPEIKKSLESNSAIILLSTDANLSTFYRDCIRKMYDIYHPEG